MSMHALFMNYLIAFMFGPGVYLQRTLISNNYAAFATKSFTTWKDLSVVTEIEIVKHAMNFS